MQTRPREPGEGIFAYVLLLLGGVVLIEAHRLEGLRSPSSAGIFPLLAGVAMVGSAIAVILRNRRIPVPDRPDGAPALRLFIQRVVPPAVVVVTLLLLGYMLVLEPLGFLVASFAFLFTAMLYLHRRGPLLAAAIAGGTLALVYLVFRVAFTVVLPTGWLFR